MYAFHFKLSLEDDHLELYIPIFYLSVLSHPHGNIYIILFSFTDLAQWQHFYCREQYFLCAFSQLSMCIQQTLTTKKLPLNQLTISSPKTGYKDYNSSVCMPTMRLQKGYKCEYLYSQQPSHSHFAIKQGIFASLQHTQQQKCTEMYKRGGQNNMNVL